MARKNLSFNLSEETYARIRELFPDQTGSEGNLTALMDTYEHPPQPDNSHLIKELEFYKEQLQASEALLQQQQQLFDTYKAEKEEEIILLHSNSEKLSKQLSDEIIKADTSLDHLREAHEQLCQTLSSGNIPNLPEPTGTLLSITAERLSVKYKKPVTPLDVLLDMFIRYTVEQYNEWFYPFIISKSEFKELCGYSARELKAWLDGKPIKQNTEEVTSVES